MSFDFGILSLEDRAKALQILGNERQPDYSFAAQGVPYVHRWYVIPRNAEANAYLHVQTADDPGDWYHDHRWDNVSVILANAYREIMFRDDDLDWITTANPLAFSYTRIKGDVVFRRANWAHRIMKHPNHAYSMSLFSTGPVIRDWGFWMNGKWIVNTDLLVTLPDGRSVLKTVSDAM